MKFKSVLFLFLASIILFGFSQQTNAESQESNVTPSQESYAHDVLNEQLSSNLSTTDAIQQRAHMLLALGITQLTVRTLDTRNNLCFSRKYSS